MSKTVIILWFVEGATLKNSWTVTTEDYEETGVVYIPFSPILCRELLHRESKTSSPNKTGSEITDMGLTWQQCFAKQIFPWNFFLFFVAFLLLLLLLLGFLVGSLSQSILTYWLFSLHYNEEWSLLWQRLLYRFHIIIKNPNCSSVRHMFSIFPSLLFKLPLQKQPRC